MAYSDYGAFVYMDGKRRRDKEDVGVYDTDEAGLPSGLRIWANILKNEEAGHDQWWRRSQHGVMGDGKVRVSCYKQYFPDVWAWEDGQEEPRRFTEDEIIAHNGWTADDPWVRSWEHDGEMIDLYVENWDYHGVLEFTVPGLDGYTFSHECGGKPYVSTMAEPDGTAWRCEYDYQYGAGFEEV